MNTARSYCTGYTGLEMAVRAVIGDFEVLSHSDIKPASVALLAHRYPDVPNLGDMRAIDYTGLDRTDLMIGSWPCQPHSAAGRRLGEADPRDLWPEYLRAIDATRPAIFFGENVARIASNGELRRAVRSLAERGYVGAWRSVRASDVGACHRRDRAFVVAIDPVAYAGGEAGRFTGDTEQGDSAGTAGFRSPESGRRGHGAGLSLLPTPMAVTLLPTPKASGGEKGGPGMRGRKGDLFLPSAVVQLLPTPNVADSRNTRNATANRSPGQEHHHSGWTLSDVAHADRWGIYANAVAHHEQVLGRPAPDPTQISLRNGRPQLSARFVEWMQMLPEGWVTDVPGLVDSPRKSVRNAQLSLLGDGVVPAQGAAAFRFLLGHLVQRLSSECAT